MTPMVMTTMMMAINSISGDSDDSCNDGSSEGNVDHDDDENGEHAISCEQIGRRDNSRNALGASAAHSQRISIRERVRS